MEIVGDGEGELENGRGFWLDEVIRPRGLRPEGRWLPIWMRPPRMRAQCVPIIRRVAARECPQARVRDARALHGLRLILW